MRFALRTVVTSLFIALSTSAQVAPSPEPPDKPAESAASGDADSGDPPAENYAEAKVAPKDDGTTEERPTALELLSLKKTRQTALAVSGGISLGSYQAGINWAVLELMKTSQRASLSGIPVSRLRAMTGASAGNINAFLAALEHCKDPSVRSADPVTDNWLRNAWLEIGIDQLFPGGQTCEEYRDSLRNGRKVKDGEVAGELECSGDRDLYLEKDGALSRRAFDYILHDIKQTLIKPNFVNGCGFPIGITVTKVIPEQVEGQGPEINVTTQRFAVLLEAKVRDKRLVFTQPPTQQSGNLVGNRMYLPERDGQVPVQHVLDLILASSAFPLAFGPVDLDYCLTKDLVKGRCLQSSRSEPRKLACDDEERMKCDAFIDGGLYDNLPLGLAVTALRTELPVVGVSDQPVILYMDPEKVRSAGQASTYMPGAAQSPEDVLVCSLSSEKREKKRTQTKAEPNRGVAHLVTMLGRFVKVARTYEMQSLVRFDNDNDAVVAATDRYSPIFGGYLGAFAAFLSRDLREYDYYVGVYDGLFHAAAQKCGLKKTGDVGQAKCLLETVPQLATSLSIKKGSSAQYIVSQLLRSELTVVVPRDRWDAFSKEHRPLLQKLEESSTDDKVLVELHRAMALAHAYRAAFKEGPDFEWVLTQAAAVKEHLPPCEKKGARCANKPERLLFTNREALLGDLAKHLAQRLVDIEREEKGKAGSQIVGVVQFGTETFFNGKEPRPRWRWSPSTVPQREKWTWRLLTGAIPHYATAELLDGGAEVGYLPTYYSGGLLGVTFPAAPFSWSRLGTFSIRGGASAVLNLNQLFLSRLELGPTVSFDYYSEAEALAEERTRFGLEVAAQILLNKFRVSFDANTTLENLSTKVEQPLSANVRVGISDLNGILYWSGRALF